MLPDPICSKPLPPTMTVELFESMYAIPSAIEYMPSVTTRELILNKTTSTPFRSPIPAAANAAISDATHGLSPSPTSIPISTELSAITLPIETSISPPMITIVSATAITPSTLTTPAAVARLLIVKKYGDSSHMITNTTTNTSSSPWP